MSQGEDRKERRRREGREMRGDVGVREERGRERTGNENRERIEVMGLFEYKA